jgi:nucleoside 2-deoxyribosyltransferase
VKRKKIYLAGPLFGIADRHHNLLLAKELERLGYAVVLPQRQASNPFEGYHLQLIRIAEYCRNEVLNSDYVVANIDGSDADSGTAVEVGMALSKAPLATHAVPVVICVRTDIRTEADKEIGMNAMFRLAQKVICRPANVSSLQEIRTFYRELAGEIHSSIMELGADT